MARILGTRRARALLTATIGFAIVLPASAFVVDPSVVTLGSPTATFCQTTGGNWPITAAVDNTFGAQNGWAVDPQENNDQVAIFKAAADINNPAGTALTFQFFHQFQTGHQLGKFRLAATTSDRSTYGQGATCGDANPGGSAVWTVLVPEFVYSANGQTMTAQGDGTVFASGALPNTDLVTLGLTTRLQGITGFRLEVLRDDSLPHGGPGRYPSNGNFVLTELTVNQVPVATIPTLNEWGLLLTALALGAAGFVVLRRRRS